ncbi:TcpQ domain-containing protein [Burkholderia cepacia]|uniref:TcpQ domain-containing protein n=1 Tax=Burkholderia cepacia TaxID=292 RepID=UPI002ABE0814|nr:TcpQ domain-containing protein [Burkholderia cepacia]
MGAHHSLRRYTVMFGALIAATFLPACNSLAYHPLATAAYTMDDVQTVAWDDDAAFHPLRRPQARPVARDPGFDVRPDDQTLAGALSRWAKQTGSTIRWESPISVPVTAASHIPGTLPQAMNAIQHALSGNGYPLIVASAPDYRTWLVLDAPSSTPSGALTR